ncbi:high mobility group box domain-containing protein, partial [Mycena olivaceomarginata]
RPENAFILFRRKFIEDNTEWKKERRADLSKMVAKQWKGLSPEERSHWEALAKEKRREHEALYPNYVYR